MSNGSLFGKFTQIERTQLEDHRHLTPEDECYYLGEYTARGGPLYSITNQIVLNFKKSVDHRGRPDWPYKGQAIRTVAQLFSTLNTAFRRDAVFVPIPPSKEKEHPLYDDRLIRMLQAVSSDLDVRELLIQRESSEAAHSRESGHRDSPDEIAGRYYVDKMLLHPDPKQIAIVDDLLTTGAHFRAASAVLRKHFPQTTLVGLFIARRVLM